MVLGKEVTYSISADLCLSVFGYKFYYCIFSSGGIQRDWVGVPRMLFTPGSSHSRCVCVQPSNPVHSENRNLREYKDCPPHADSCRITKD